MRAPRLPLRAVRARRIAWKPETRTSDDDFVAGLPLRLRRGRPSASPSAGTDAVEKVLSVGTAGAAGVPCRRTSASWRAGDALVSPDQGAAQRAAHRPTHLEPLHVDRDDRCKEGEEEKPIGYEDDDGESAELLSSHEVEAVVVRQPTGFHQQHIALGP